MIELAEPPLVLSIWLLQLLSLVYCWAKLKELPPEQTSHHHHDHRSLSFLLLLSESSEQGSFAVGIHNSILGLCHYSHGKSLSSFPKEQHLKEPGSLFGKYFVSFLFVSDFSVFGEGETQLSKIK